MEYHVFLEQDESGAFIADVPAIPGCHSWGATKEEALANIREAIALCLEVQGSPASHFIGVETVSVGA